MFKISLFFLLFSFSDICGHTNNDTDIKEISLVLATQQESWNAGDIDAFMTGYWNSDSLMFIGSTGLTYGWQNTLTNYKKRYPDKASMGTLKFEIIKLEILSPGSAMLIGRYTLIREKDTPSGLFTLIWKKINGKWLITSDQTCG